MDNTEKLKTGTTTMGRSLPISTRHSIEICSLLRGKTSEQGRKILERVITKKSAVPYRKHMHGVGHRSGNMAAGRYPEKASSYILGVLKNAESNAQDKGLIAPFIIKEIVANQASRSWHYGRQKRRKTKRTHLKVVLEELKSAKEKVEAKSKKEK